MSPLNLPYLEYSWSLSQHMRRAVNDSRIIFSLLRGAEMFGMQPNYAENITRYIIQQGIIPPNIRDDRPQIWRDYQQILVELGLIISTRYTQEQVLVTPIGLAWLDGLIGTSEMLTTQALGYQYPNAYKLSLPNAVREQLEVQDVTNRVRLDMQSGVLIKPAVLILRILLELIKIGIAPEISSRECVAALMPIKKNSEWALALGELIQIRAQNPTIETSVRSLRHTQEWFALLNATDIFVENENGISLSESALAEQNLVEELCKYHEDLANFWYPSPNMNVSGWVNSWFSYYGTPGLEKQWLLPETNRSPDYIEENYLEGEEESEEESAPTTYIQDWAGLINTAIYDRPFPQNDGQVVYRRLNAEEAERYAQGIERRRRATRLHEYIVSLLANRLQQEDFIVEEDRQSVDLLAKKGETETILEVKTVNAQNLVSRMRLGVGQISEYRYRRQMQAGNRPSAILVLSNSVQLPDWLTNYFQNDIQMGLIGLSSRDQFVAYTQGAIEILLESDNV